MDHKLIYVCEGGDCSERGSMEVFLELKDRLQKRDPGKTVLPRKYPCFGGCEVGINMVVYPDRFFYSGVTEEDLDEIVDHLVGDGKPVDRLTGKVQKDVEDIIYELLDTGF